MTDKTTEQLEAEKLALEVQSLELENEHSRAKILWYSIQNAANKRQQDRNQAEDYANGQFMLFSTVDTPTVRGMTQSLSEYARQKPGAPITLVLNSPGGSVLDGLALYDLLLDLRGDGHYVTTHARGMAASMGGILLQAGDKRIMSSNAQLLIHKVSNIAFGDLDSLEDKVEHTKRLNERLLDILASRSLVEREEIEKGWHRKDWWLDAAGSLERGFCDEVR